MLKRIDYLYHFTREFSVLKEILRHGLKVSYAKETIEDKNIIVPMISFSNILLRDVGTEEVLNYGNYAICLSREWGIANEINPVAYTYEKGVLYSGLNTFLYNSLILSTIQQHKSKLKSFTDNGWGPISRQLVIKNNPKEVTAIMDYLSMNYDEKLVDILADYAKSNFDANMPILTLTKQYKVVNAQGVEFIAYNDREWRKLYPDLEIHFEGDAEYLRWVQLPKPHFNKAPYLLKFTLEDIKAILVNSVDEVDIIIEELKSIFGESTVDTQLDSCSLLIGTKEELEKKNF